MMTPLAVVFAALGGAEYESANHSALCTHEWCGAQANTSRAVAVGGTGLPELSSGTVLQVVSLIVRFGMLELEQDQGGGF